MTAPIALRKVAMTPCPSCRPLVLIALVGLAAALPAWGQLPGPPDPAVPGGVRVRRAPQIGIHVRNVRWQRPRQQIIDGALVTRDTLRRPLYRLDQNGRRRPQRFHFRVGHDVIIRVNGQHVRTANDIRMDTRVGWNTLLIWDDARGTLSEYDVQLD